MLKSRLVDWIRIAALAALAAPGIASAATVSTDRGVWSAGLSGARIFETFDTDIATDDSITFASGIVSTKSSSGVPPTLNRVRGGSYAGFTVKDDFRTVTWDLPTPAFGFGGDFGGGGSAFGSLLVTANYARGSSESFSISETLGRGDGFFGLSGSRAIASLLFSTEAGVNLMPGGAPFGGQLFTADDVTVAPVPVPAALPLMLSGLALAGGFGLSRRKRAVKASS